MLVLVSHRVIGMWSMCRRYVSRNWFCIHCHVHILVVKGLDADFKIQFGVASKCASKFFGRMLSYYHTFSPGLFKWGFVFLAVLVVGFNVLFHALPCVASILLEK